MGKRIIIAGGGTGGHIFPAVAAANALKSMDASIEILFVGAKGKMEMEKVPKEGYKIIGLDIAGFNRSSMLKNLTLPFKLIKSYMQAKKVIADFKPDVCLGVGGYASFPVLRVAQRMNIPTVLQEQNSFAGKSNKILGRKAKLICVAYDNMEQFFPKNKIVKTGNPVRQSIVESKVNKDEGLAFFGLDKSKKTVFAFGGSLGAKSINEALANKLSEFEKSGVQLIWQTGKFFIQHAKEAAASNRMVNVHEFITEMEYAYAAADVIISRAGALSIAELCLVAKPVVFVPYPHASEDHQTHNAMALVNKSAALLVKDSLADAKLVETAFSLLDSDQAMAQNLKEIAVPNAAMDIAQKILEVAA